MSKKLLIVTSLYVVFFGMLLLTQPKRLPLPLLVLPFIILFVAINASFVTLLRRTLKSMDTARRRFVSLSISGLLVFALVLSSINQLTVKDLILTGVLASGFLFYMSRVHFIKQ